MNDERLQAWLRRGDGALPAAPAGLADRLRRRRRRKQLGNAAAGAAAAAILVLVGGRFGGAPPPAEPPPAWRAELAELEKSAAELHDRIAAIQVPPPRTGKLLPLPRSVRRELADARAAALLAWHAEHQLNVLGDKADALARFRALVELFPATPAGLAAVAEVSRLSKELM